MRNSNRIDEMETKKRRWSDIVRSVSDNEEAGAGVYAYEFIWLSCFVSLHFNLFINCCYLLDQRYGVSELQ